MKYCEISLFLLLMIMDVSTNAQEVTCEGEQLINVDILMGHPGTAPPYKPGHILGFRCTDVNLKMYGQRAIECLSNGKWDYPYPRCEEIRCEVPRDQHVSYPEYYFRGDMKLETTMYYYCVDGYEKMAEVATCTQDGWTPKPLCEKMCAAPYIPNAEIVEGKTKTSKYQIYSKIKYQCLPGFEPEQPIEITCDSRLRWNGIKQCTEKMCATPNIPNAEIVGGNYRIHSRIEYKCSPGFGPEQRIQITCDSQGQWTDIQQCTGQDSRTCGRPLHIINSEIKDMVKKEYNTGEKVEYKCADKYILDMRHPFSNYLTCEQGKWSGNIKCLKPCTVTKEIMDGRGIEFAYAVDKKIIAPHDDHIEFRCQGHKDLKRNELRQRCNDGEMTLPECE